MSHLIVSKKPKNTIEIDITHANAANQLPYIIMFGIYIQRYISLEKTGEVLGKMWQKSQRTSPLEVLHVPISFLEDEDKKERLNKHAMRAQLHLSGTVCQLLEAAKANAAQDRGILFLFAEIPGMIGVADSDRRGVGHFWAGMLLKKTGTKNEEWCLNIFCIWNNVRQGTSVFLTQLNGRRKLWSALSGDNGMRVTEVNVSNVRLSNLPDTCVINTMYWLYMASEMEGGCWKADDPRRRALHLHPLDLSEIQV